jgi:hypothetical protein
MYNQSFVNVIEKWSIGPTSAVRLAGLVLSVRIFVIHFERSSISLCALHEHYIDSLIYMLFKCLPSFELRCIILNETHTAILV